MSGKPLVPIRAGKGEAVLPVPELEPGEPVAVALRPSGHATLLIASGHLGTAEVKAVGGPVRVGGGEVGHGGGTYTLEDGEMVALDLGMMSDSVYGAGTGAVTILWTRRPA